MRVYIVSGVFPPEPVMSARIAGDIAEEMTRRGHDVTVFCPFPNRPSGQVMPGYKRAWHNTVQRNGYRIVYCWHTLSKKSTLASRVAENISFGLTSTWKLLRAPAPDVVYMNTWPIFAQSLSSFVLNRRRVPVVCAIKDLYPETVSDTGRYSSNHPLIKLARAVDNRVYERSKLVAPLNSATKDYLVTDRKVNPDKIVVVPDWLDAADFPTQQLKNLDFRREHGLTPDDFVAMYVGSMTRMAGLKLYVEAAERLRHRSDIQILLVGDGSMREEVQTMIRQKDLKNIKSVYPLMPEDVPNVQAASDVLMLSLLPGTAIHTTPSKLIFYMFSSRPVVASVADGGPPARIISDAGCGYVVPQNDPQALADRLMHMADHRESLAELGENARTYAKLTFLKENGLPHACDILENAAQIRDSQP